MIRHVLAGCAVVLLTLSMGGAAASAHALRNYCASAKQLLDGDSSLADAARAAFPHAEFTTRDTECLFPLKVLRYGDADVLLVVGGKPGEACHGCSADLSAYVLRRLPGRSIVAARYVDFATSGTSGDPGRIDAIQLAGDDAFAVEAGGMFQGYAVQTLTLFVFRAGRLVQLKPALPLRADNSGAMTDDNKAISVEGSWRVDPDRPGFVTITYRVRAHGRDRKVDATWRVRGNALDLTKGQVPPEYEAAGGG